MLKTFFSFKSDDVGINDLRVAIFNILFAENHDGEYIITVENAELESKLKTIGLKKLILSENNQSNDNIYQETANKLINLGCACQKDDRVILSVSEKDIVDFKDAIKGNMTVNPSEINDFILLKDQKNPSDDFKFIVDCYKFGTTHIIRKESDQDLIKRQKILNHILKRNTPATALIPEITTDTDLTLDSLLKDGFKGKNIFNYLATIGRTDFQKFCKTRQQIEDTFSVDSLSKVVPKFDKEHLKWMDTECKRG